MLVVGMVGWGSRGGPHPTHLLPNEQVTHITLWSMLSAPLLIGCDMTKLDKFTTDLLTNADVLDIDQDPLGKPANVVSRNGRTEVWARPLFDGTLAVALFNRGVESTSVGVQWSDLTPLLADKGALGQQPVRDLWHQKDLGSFSNAFSTDVPAHGAVLLKIGKPKE
jgi:alpha-galactosidase